MLREFRPSQMQRRFLDQLEAQPQANIRAVCEQLDIARSTYYRWCRDPGFRLWISEAWISRLLLDGATLINVARAKAPTSFPYWKAMFQLIFSGDGLAHLEIWKEACAGATTNAFFSADDPDPEPEPEPQPAPAEALELKKLPAGVASDPTPNQQTMPENATPCGPGAPVGPMPNRLARNFIRVLAPSDHFLRAPTRPNSAGRGVDPPAILAS